MLRLMGIWSEAWTRLLRPDEHVVLRLLESQPLTVDDVLAAEAWGPGEHWANRR